jgi:peptidoglycan/xylan/chitin deacetylase (PgdA/CDA1 family)
VSQDNRFRLVTNTTTQHWSRRRFMGGAVSVAALGSLAAGCSGGADQQASPSPSRAPAPRAAGTPATGRPATDTRTGSKARATTSGVDAELIRRRYLGLKPFPPAPPPPAVKPITLSASDPTVFSNVPMTDKVVFITVDDGLYKDPRYIQMVKDFQIPITIDLANLFISDDYEYFEKLYETGYVSIQNHTVHHLLDMPALSASQQLYEIAGQQEILHKEYGVTPFLFRAPGGNYDETTIQMAGQAGLKGVMMWKETMQITDMEYQTSAHRLNPGDIILSHFRGPAQLDGESMIHMMIWLYRHIQDQGFTVADLTKYV